MKNKTLSIFLALVAVVVVFIAIWQIGKMFNPDLDLDETALLRFVFVGVGLLIAFLVYLATSKHKMWEVGTREVVYMAIGAALYAIFSYLFNGTVFVVPSVSQVSLRPAIAIPMFFGYAFGPVVGLFTGAVGNMFGDALTGFGLSPQWSVGNGLVGFIAGLSWLFSDKKKGINTVLIVSAVLTAIATVFYLMNSNQSNTLFYDVENNIFGDAQISLFAGISIVIGFVLVLLVRFVFGKNIDVAAAVTWSMLGNLLGMGFAAISDIWINGYSPAVAIVGEFIPSAGPNLIFAAILVPLLVSAFSASRRQTGR
ncbi:ECF transporter S component [Pelolinea submarina]|uniref:Putative membrane protein n=1 Tax=Pelolinea submarina TaxID=913107 RepID=A0A3E0AGJ3_9CHLR|nr:ECF transporter S component [Pelolinea submarina]REG10786.1 putative membrane protein [Pelolinea submarina]